jgi:hypothetical protein
MTKPFDFYDHEAIREAVSHPTGDQDKLSHAMTVRLEALRDVLKQSVEETGEFPRYIDVATPKTVLDQVVIEMFQKILREEGVTVAEGLDIDPSELSWVPVVRIVDCGRE